MRRLVLGILLGGFAVPAAAQYRTAPPPPPGYDAGPDDDGADPGYDDGGYGYAPPYRPQAPNQGGQPTTPGYRDDERWAGGDAYSSTDARGGGATADYRRQQRDYRAQLDDYNRRMRAYRGQSGGYAARAAAMRARADACERGDEDACE